MIQRAAVKMALATGLLLLSGCAPGSADSKLGCGLTGALDKTLTQQDYTAHRLIGTAPGCPRTPWDKFGCIDDSAMVFVRQDGHAIWAAVGEPWKTAQGGMSDPAFRRAFFTCQGQYP